MMTIQENLSILMVGRILEEERIFIKIKQIADNFQLHTSSIFYLTNKLIVDALKKERPDFICIVFQPLKHTKIMDYIVTIGGDGTILYAIKQFKDKVPPVITFQHGSLGFLCRFPIQGISTVIERIVQFRKTKKDYPFDQTHIMRIEVIKTTKDKQIPAHKLRNSCINEVYISRITQQRISLQIYVNNQFFTRTSGDGILISTPTGSTAYALSAGGPVIQNGVNCIMIVPIAPDSLSFRPICLSTTAKIQVRLSNTTRSEAYLSFDGQVLQSFKLGDQLTITQAKQGVTFLEPKKGESIEMPTWIQRLKYFLGWNQNYVNPPKQMTVQRQNIHSCQNK